jgi:hypothetical protein
MVTHGIPPAAEGGWSEFIKDFGIGPLLGASCAIDAPSDRGQMRGDMVGHRAKSRAREVRDQVRPGETARSTSCDLLPTLHPFSSANQNWRVNLMQ